MPAAYHRVVDRAIQVWGAAGVSGDLPLAGMYQGARTLRIADGPDEVHKILIAKNVLRRYHSGERLGLRELAATPSRPAAAAGPGAQCVATRRLGSGSVKTMTSARSRRLVQRWEEPWRWLIWFMKPSVEWRSASEKCAAFE